MRTCTMLNAGEQKRKFICWQIYTRKSIEKLTTVFNEYLALLLLVIPYTKFGQNNIMAISGSLRCYIICYFAYVYFFVLLVLQRFADFWLYTHFFQLPKIYKHIKINPIHIPIHSCKTSDKFGCTQFLF